MIVLKNFLALFGGFVLILFLLGSMDIGNFVLMYSLNPLVCIKGI